MLRASTWARRASRYTCDMSPSPASNCDSDGGTSVPSGRVVPSSLYFSVNASARAPSVAFTCAWTRRNRCDLVGRELAARRPGVVGGVDQLLIGGDHLGQLRRPVDHLPGAVVDRPRRPVEEVAAHPGARSSAGRGRSGSRRELLHAAMLTHRGLGAGAGDWGTLVTLGCRASAACTARLPGFVFPVTAPGPRRPAASPATALGARPWDPPAPRAGPARTPRPGR